MLKNIIAFVLKVSTYFYNFLKIIVEKRQILEKLRVLVYQN